MFSFGFAVDDDGDITQDVHDIGSRLAIGPSIGADDVPARMVPLEELFAALPPRLSYSPLIVRTGECTELHLARRDLFDAKYQIMSGESDEASGLQFVDAASDLVRGVYEGGLKTWECASDLVHFVSDGIANNSAATLELGCGTAVPSAYVLSAMLSERPSNTDPRALHIQDYNRIVLELVALPNIILAWYFSPAASSIRDATRSAQEAGEIDVDEELISAFQATLASHHIDLRFFYGSWTSWQLPQAYDLVLSSETVYEPSSIPTFVSLLRATGGRRFIAAKRIYFGVGGGIREFTEEVECAGGKVETVWETSIGVARAILDVKWD